MIGVRRRIKGDEPIHTITEREIDDRLAWPDHVVDILPLSDSTSNFFTTARFARMKRTALFYNIGRGRTVDQDALRDALERGVIAGGYLDVTTPEPLSPDDPLWKVRNCFITPHTGGGFLGERDEQVAHFERNLKRYERGEQLVDRVV